MKIKKNSLQLSFVMLQLILKWSNYSQLADWISKTVLKQSLSDTIAETNIFKNNILKFNMLLASSFWKEILSISTAVLIKPMDKLTKNTEIQIFSKDTKYNQDGLINNCQRQVKLILYLDNIKDLGILF